MARALHLRPAGGTRHLRSSVAHVALVLVATVAACERTDPTASSVTGPGNPSRSLIDDGTPSHAEAELLRQLAAAKNITPLVHPAPVRKELVLLGQALLFDPILSGNRDIACMTCHLPAFATGDGRNLSIGQGGIGFGPQRQLGKGFVIPRNAPPLFNLTMLSSLFWDGRVSRDSNGTFHTPANAQLSPQMASVFEFGPASAIGLFPVTSRTEMRAFVGGATTLGGFPKPGNELALLADSDFTGIWSALMKRLGAIPAYRQMFEAAYPGTPFSSMTFAHATNAMGGFFTDRMSFNNSPWDKFLAGDDHALSPQEFRGGNTFVTTKCSGCHGGPTFTDGKFRNVALAQFGPGQGNGPSGHDDFGRLNVTGVATDKYLFRTSPLRNIELSGPYGHAGEFAKLRDFVDHYSDADNKLINYDVTQIEASLRPTLLNNTADILATRSGALTGLFFTPEQIDDITAYLRALTDPAAKNMSSLTPGKVPSGLPVAGVAPGGLGSAIPFTP
ncbi:MAG TPA: cytochrome c peroxidase [Gemmatimonadaceae bacterium]|nr:cytochrome c peroxidase [Gemmatimonadaceae bacterium]